MKTKIETFLPIFPGFYNTIFEPYVDDEIECINEEREAKGLKPVDFDQIEFNYQDYEEKTASNCCDFIETALHDQTGIDISVNFQNVVSPKYYNYSNDSINCEIEVNIKDLTKYVKSHYSDFCQWVKDNYTSYDGFMSFVTNNPVIWIDELLTEKTSHKVGALIGFILQNSYDGSESLQVEMYCYNTDHDGGYIYADNYDELINNL